VLFRSAGIRLIEILNDRGYAEHDPQPQPVVWERMNLPIARGLRGLIYVLWDLSQVDPSDLSILFAGDGRLRIGFAEIDPSDGVEPSDDQVDQAARRCCDNPYYAFHKPAGTSLICIQGDWSNLVDARIKGRLAAAMGGEAKSPYSPLYARAVGTPRPWGVTALFAEHTGTHTPLDIDWSLERGVRTIVTTPRSIEASLESPTDHVLVEGTPIDVDEVAIPAAQASAPVEQQTIESPIVTPARALEFATFWEFAVAVNRSDPRALALAGDGAVSEIPIEGVELRKLLSLMWFRTVLARFSPHWRDRVLNVLIDTATVADHPVRFGRQTMHLRELTYDQLKEIDAKTLVPDWMRADLDLLITVGRFWGADAVKRVRFIEAPERPEPSMMETLLDRFRA